MNDSGLLKILIVEDSASVRRLLRSVVEAFANEIHECSDGADALAAYERYRPDFVLMDIQMDRTDGITATRQIRAADGLALDGAGNVFIADADHSSVVEVPAGCTSSSCQTTVGSGLAIPSGAAVDGAGDVFIADAANSSLVQVQRSQPPALSFAATAVGSTSSDSPQSVTVQNIGNLSLNAVAPGLSIGGTNSSSFKQVAGSGTPPDCTATFSLVPGASCDLSISFTPAVSGSNTGAVTLTDNALNGNPATQSIQLSGTGTDFAITATPGSETISSGHTATYTLTISSLSGFSGSVSLGCAGGPPHSSCSVSPASVSLSASTTANATVRLSTPQNVNHGTFGLTFTASSGVSTHSASVTLTVK